MELLNYIQANWVEWLFAGGFALLGYGFRQLRKQQQEESARNAALREGVSLKQRNRGKPSKKCIANKPPSN